MKTISLNSSQVEEKLTACCSTDYENRLGLGLLPAAKRIVRINKNLTESNKGTDRSQRW